MTSRDGGTDLLPLVDAAEIAGISARTLALWAKRGLIRSVLTSDGRRLISRTELAKHVVTPSAAQPPDE